MAAPIALFVYSRLWHTQQTVEALKKNDLASESDLYIFSDGPKSEKGKEPIKQLRQYLKTIDGFKSVNIVESERNKGLTDSIISGVNYVLAKHGTVIVLEDDLVTSPKFLSYMNQGINLYRNDAEVVSIHGYFFPVPDENLPASFFIKGADCWGWATWSSAWKIFDANPWRLLIKILLRGLKREFDFNNSYGYTRMLFSQCIGRIDSWAIRWYASAFLEGKLTLYPSISLVKNIGLDESGTHTRPWHKEAYDTTLDAKDVILTRIEIKESAEGRLARANYFRATQIPLIKKIAHKFRFFIKRFL